jgi:alpha-glucoside transport system substrate-binding protein
VLDTAAVDASLLRPVRGEGTVGGQRWAVPFRVAVNGLIWYRPALFEQYGYEVPRTYPDLLALLEDMHDDGIYPWCLGAESAQETGAVLTDWIEDLLLRTAGPEVYDGLVARDVPFDAPEIQRAGELFAELALEPGRVQGGRIGLLTTPESSAFLPMFEDTPGCGLYRAGTDAEVLFENMPDHPDVEVGRDVAMFPFPPVETRYGQPLTGSADVAALVTANPGAEALLRWLATPAAANAWIGAGEDAPLLSPYRAFDPAAYPNAAQAAQARLLARTRVFREDASLQMPDWLGSFAFHWELIDWVDGRRTLPEALTAIQRSQPRAVDQPTAFPRSYDVGG